MQKMQRQLVFGKILRQAQAREALVLGTKLEQQQMRPAPVRYFFVSKKMVPFDHKYCMTEYFTMLPCVENNFYYVLV